MTAWDPKKYVAERQAVHGIRAKKSWGQNFLIDRAAYDDIVNACELDSTQHVVEIGAGLGPLTYALSQRDVDVTAIERDRDLVPILQQDFVGTRVTVVEDNALTFDFAAIAKQVGKPLTVVGNLPYNISSPILFRLLDAKESIRLIVVMLQHEVALRLVAAHDTEDYGSISVLLQAYFNVEYVSEVNRRAFVPPPRVDSAIVRLVPKKTDGQMPAFSTLQKVVHAAFGQRRKTLRNSLRSAVDEALYPKLEAAGFDLQRRGETLSVSEFIKVALLVESDHA